MKVYLDDLRPVPDDSWTLVRWPIDVIRLIKEGGVTEISLDHDLGDDQRGTGYDVLEWMELRVHLEGLIPPKIRIHTANVSARAKMEMAVISMNNFINKKEK